MTPAVEGARLVREEGLSVTVAAQRVGCTYSAIYKRLHPEKVRAWSARDNARRGPEKRAWENAHRAPCPSCGRPQGAGSERADGTRRIADVCPECQHQRLVLNIREVVRLRREEDLSNAEIAERVGMAKLSVATRLKECRAMGLEVPLDPYNRPPGGYRKKIARRECKNVTEDMARAIIEAFPELREVDALAKDAA